MESNIDIVLNNIYVRGISKLEDKESVPGQQALMPLWKTRLAQ